MSYIFSFSSRNSALRFADAVTMSGGRVQLVNSPIEKGSGCGLAVKCSDYDLCEGVLNRGHYAYLRSVYEFDGSDYKTLYNTTK